MASPRKLAASAALLLGSLLVMAGRADAFDLNGAWASDADQCAKVFARQGGRLGFAEMSDVYGGGFIIDGVGLVHALLLRIQALLLPIKTLVLSGH